MHAEEGIIDAGDRKEAYVTRCFNTKYLHRYHLFFLEMLHHSTLLLSRQGHLTADISLLKRYPCSTIRRI